MKTLTIRKRVATWLAILVGLAGALVLAAPMIASATSGPLPVCAQGTVSVSWDGANGFTARTSGDECRIALDIYAVPKTWDGGGFDASASPQHLLHGYFANLSGQDKKFWLRTPRCGPYQADAADVGYLQASVTYPSGSDGFLAGGLNHGRKCTPPPPPPTTSTPPPTSSTTSTPPPTSTTSTPPPTSTTSTPPPTSTTSTPPPTSTSSTTSAPPPTKHTTPPPPTGTVPPSTPKTPETLAFTGANGVVWNSIGGVVLIAIGVLLIAVFRRSPSGTHRHKPPLT